MRGVIGDGLVEDRHGASDFDRSGWLVGVQERDDEPAVNLGEEDGDAEALGRRGVGVGARQTGYEAVQAEATEVVGHLGRRVGVAKQAGHQAPEALVGEAVDGVDHD